MNKLSYSLGLYFGHQLREWELSDKLRVDDFAAGINDVLKGNDPQIDMDEAQNQLNTFFAQLEQKQRDAQASGEAVKAEGERFLADNAKRTGVTVTPSGLQYEVLAEGSGRSPKASDTVRCHYHGTLIDGTVFDSSYQRNQPADFGLNQVIAGWTEGLQLMKEGAKYRFYLPYHLAYGEYGAGNTIPPYAALVFDVELLKVL